MTLIEDRFPLAVAPAVVDVDNDVDLPDHVRVIDAEPDVVQWDILRLISPLGAKLAARWIAVLVVAWVVIFSLGVSLEPPTPATRDSPAEAAVASALLISWAGAIIGFIHRRRYGALASTLGAVCLVVMTFACVLSGHHQTIGAWWWFQVVGSESLLGLSAKALTAR